MRTARWYVREVREGLPCSAPLRGASPCIRTAAAVSSSTWSGRGTALSAATTASAKPRGGRVVEGGRGRGEELAQCLPQPQRVPGAFPDQRLVRRVRTLTASTCALSPA